MRLILLSGGSGKRLWPLSNDTRSKQFLKVLDDGNGEHVSMIQRIWQQLKLKGLHTSSLIATNKAQVDLINGQLDENVEIIIEPSRKDTFPAIALASSYLISEMKVSEDEVVVVLPVDLYVEDTFFDYVKKLEEVIKNNNVNLALLGVKPTSPSEKFGYIVPKDTRNEKYYTVEKFVEKPNENLAVDLIEKNALWNCGIFAFKLSYIIEKLKDNKLSLDYKSLLQDYDSLKKNSFDYAVVEKEPNIAVVPYNGAWKDLGSWETLTEEISSIKVGNGVLSDSCNTNLVNELDIPITIIGIDDAIVAASPDGILISNKSKSHEVKNIVNLFDNRPMFEERRWGLYRVLGYSKLTNGSEVLTKHICITKGKNLSYQKHSFRSEVWTVVAGTGEFALDGEIKKVKPGDVLKIAVGQCHGIKAIEDLEIIEVQSGTPLIEEDIIRLYMTWDEVVKICKYKSEEV